MHKSDNQAKEQTPSLHEDTPDKKEGTFLHVLWDSTRGQKLVFKVAIFHGL